MRLFGTVLLHPLSCDYLTSNKEKQVSSPPISSLGCFDLGEFPYHVGSKWVRFIQRTPLVLDPGAQDIVEVSTGL